MNYKDRVMVLIKMEGNEKTFQCGQFLCRIWRNPALGTLNGYIGVDKSFPLYGKGLDYVVYDRKTVRDVFRVHGGLTYAGKKWNDGRWYFGFDTGHPGDYIPALDNGGTYRDMNYVKEQLESLVDQFSRFSVTKKVK